MDTKESLLNKIAEFARNHLVSKEEVVSAYERGAGVEPQKAHRLGLAEILYYIGGAIVFLGIAVLVWQNWGRYGVTTKIIATLGGGIAAYVVAVLLSYYDLDRVEQAFFLISALATPLGLYITLDNAGYDVSGAGVGSFIFGLLLAVYLISYLVFKKEIFNIFSIIFGTIFFFGITSLIAGPVNYLDLEKFIEYRFLAVGLTFIFLGYSYALAQDKKTFLSGPLYFFGLIAFLGSSLALGGWTPNQNVFWELIFPGLVLGAIFLSIYLKSKAFLAVGAFFLMAYIVKITAEYFTEGLGWPLALVLAGFAMIAVGYFSVYLNKKYIA